MIDALISDIQNPGKAAVLPNLRVADFTPSNSADSFVAYLERISGAQASWSADVESAAETDAQAADAQAAERDPRQDVRNAEDRAAQKDTDDRRAADAEEKRAESSSKASDERNRPEEAAQAQDQTQNQPAPREKTATDDGRESAAAKAKAEDAARADGEKMKGENGTTQAPERDEKVEDAGKAAAAEKRKAAAAEAAGVEKKPDRSLKPDSKVGTDNHGNAGREQPSPADEEIQAQQAVQSQAAVETAAKKIRTADAESSKEISLQKGGDEKRDSATAREGRNQRSGESEGRPKLTVIDRRGTSARSGQNGGQNGGNRGNGNGADARAGFNNAHSAPGNGAGHSSASGAGMNAGGSARGGNGEGEGLQIMQVHLQGEGSQPGSTIQTVGRSGDTGIRGQLLQQLQDHLNNDIVKRSSILIRENGKGEIKLDLKPDNLGQVRIRITMENNHIAGKIFVENSSVKEAFDQNMQQLYRAFKEHGFEDAALNVSVGDQGREEQQRGRSHGPQPRVASQQLHTLDEQSGAVSENGGELRLVDVMA